MARVNFELKRERIQQSVKFIKDLYDMAFDNMSLKVLKISAFKVDLKIGIDRQELIDADRTIVFQTQALKYLDKLYPEESGYLELRKRLIMVHKQIVKVLKEEYRVSNYRLDAFGEDMEYYRD